MAKQKNLFKNYSSIKHQLLKIDNPYIFLYKFKHDADLDTLTKYFSKIIAEPKLQNVRLNNLIANEIEQIYTKSFQHPPMDILREIIWTGLVLNRYSESINKFIKLRIHFENQILLSNYIKADTILKKIEKEHGKSLWIIKNKLNLLQELEGLESQKKYENFLLDKEINTELKILIYLSSISAETNISPGHFSKILDDFFEEFSDEALKEYFKYKLKKDYHVQTKFLSKILVEENRLTLIDLYETYIDILNTILCKRVFNDNIPDKLIKIIRKLYSSIEDDRLINILRTLNIAISPTSIELNKSVIDIYDNLLQENYQEVKKSCEVILQENPFYISLYESYIESLNNLDEITYFEKDSLIYKILICYENILLGTDDTHDSIITLFKITITYSNLSFTNEILSFILGYLNDENTYKKLSGYINISIFSPIKQETYPLHSKQVYLEKFLLLYPSSENLKLLLNFDQEEENFLSIINSLNISKDNYNNFLTQYYLFKNIFEESLFYANKLQASEKTIVKNQAQMLILTILLKEKKTDEAVNALIDFYFMNKNLSYRLPIINIINRIIESIDKTSIWPTSIEAIILFYLCVIYRNHDVRSRTEFLYEHYLTSLNYTRPMELIEHYQSNNKTFNSKEIFFLKEVCISEIMKKSIYFSNYNDAERERINICHSLKNIDEKNIDIYLEEIKDREQKLFIRKESSRFDKNKIYVDIEGVKNIFDKEVKDDYLRLLSLIDTGIYKKDEKIKTIINKFNNLSQEKNISNREMLSKLYLPDIPKNEVDDLCKKIIELSRDIFVKNEHYGLDVYLSTKIRHGTISNHLRKPLEKENLITLKDSKTGEYQSNSYWNEELHNLDEHNKKLIQSSLKKFSKEHDEIIKYLSSELLQVSTSMIRKTVDGQVIQNDNKEALFKYYFSDLEIKEILYKIIDEKLDFTNFKNHLIQILWEKTDINLTSIRNIIEEDIKVRINNNFDFIEKQIKEVSGISTLKNSIARSRTDINQALTTLIAWFGRMETTDRKDYSIQDAISIVENIFKKQDNYLTTNILKSFNLKGETLDSFIDILFILFDNAFKHSKLNEQTKITVLVTQEEQHMCINLKNNVKAYDTLENLNRHIDFIFTGYGTKQATLTINKEGNTGFNKIWKLLSTDLHTANHDLNAKFIEEDSKIFFEVNLKINAEGLLI
ncbi:hypothetical protein [Sulfurimonas sp. NWX79]|uniref:hypothetical protein n=1 Tax=Sulfurimonas sp. NWX79 TaxID=2925412 RepID=UPI00320492DC